MEISNVKLEEIQKYFKKKLTKKQLKVISEKIEMKKRTSAKLENDDSLKLPDSYDPQSLQVDLEEKMLPWSKVKRSLMKIRLQKKGLLEFELVESLMSYFEQEDCANKTFDLLRFESSDEKESFERQMLVCLGPKQTRSGRRSDLSDKICFDHC
ncbi:MAG: hypothetical protein MHPSP_001442 [Paramarteilia canceri]